MNTGAKIGIAAALLGAVGVGAARLPSTYKKRGTMTRSFRYKGR